jgi:uncharacterized protein YgiM (DUF1202 family)
MNMSHRINRRSFLLGTAGAAAMAFVPASMTTRQAAMANTTFPVGANVVTTAALNVRSGAGLSHSIIVTLWQGAPLTVTGDPVWADGYNWYPIRTGYGTEGWVAGSYLSSGTVDSPAFADGDHVVTTSTLNLRQGAGLSYAVIVTLWQGAPLTIIGAPVAASGHTWYPVRTGYGTEGWVAGEFLSAGTVPSPDFPEGSTAETTARLNVRSGAGLSYAVIVTLWDGAPVTITGAPVAADGYTWYPIRTGYGTECWVAGEYLA